MSEWSEKWFEILGTDETEITKSDSPLVERRARPRVRAYRKGRRNDIDDQPGVYSHRRIENSPSTTNFLGFLKTSTLDKQAKSVGFEFLPTSQKSLATITTSTEFLDCLKPHSTVSLTNFKNSSNFGGRRTSIQIGHAEDPTTQNTSGEETNTITLITNTSTTNFDCKSNDEDLACHSNTSVEAAYGTSDKSTKYNIPLTTSNIFDQTGSKIDQSTVLFTNPRFSHKLSRKSSSKSSSTSTTNSPSFGTVIPSIGIYTGTTVAKPFATRMEQPLFGSPRTTQLNMFNQPSTSAKAVSVFDNSGQKGFGMGMPQIGPGSSPDFGGAIQKSETISSPKINDERNGTGIFIFGQSVPSTSFRQPEHHSGIPFNNTNFSTQTTFGQMAQSTFDTGRQSNFGIGNIPQSPFMASEQTNKPSTTGDIFAFASTAASNQSNAVGQSSFPFSKCQEQNSFATPQFGSNLGVSSFKHNPVPQHPKNVLKSNSSFEQPQQHSNFFPFNNVNQPDQPSFGKAQNTFGTGTQPSFVLPPEPFGTIAANTSFGQMATSSPNTTFRSNPALQPHLQLASPNFVPPVTNIKTNAFNVNNVGIQQSFSNSTQPRQFAFGQSDTPTQESFVPPTRPQTFAFEKPNSTPAQTPFPQLVQPQKYMFGKPNSTPAQSPFLQPVQPQGHIFGKPPQQSFPQPQPVRSQEIGFGQPNASSIQKCFQQQNQLQGYLFGQPNPGPTRQSFFQLNQSQEITFGQPPQHSPQLCQPLPQQLQSHTVFPQQLFCPPSTSTQPNSFANGQAIPNCFGSQQEDGYNTNRTVPLFNIPQQNPENVLKSRATGKLGLNVPDQNNNTNMACTQPQQPPSPQPAFGIAAPKICTPVIFGTQENRLEPNRSVVSPYNTQPAMGVNLQEMEQILNFRVATELEVQRSLLVLTTASRLDPLEVPPLSNSLNSSSVATSRKTSIATSTSTTAVLEVPKPIPMIRSTLKKTRFIDLSSEKNVFYDDSHYMGDPIMNFPLGQGANGRSIKKNWDKEFISQANRFQRKKNKPVLDPLTLASKPLRLGKPGRRNKSTSCVTLLTKNSAEARCNKTYKSQSSQYSTSNTSIMLKKSLDECGITLTRRGYYTVPPIKDLRQFMREDGQCLVDGFTIGRVGCGNVCFPDCIDIANLNLDEIVHFRRREVVVYPDESNKPPVGEGLNRRAQVTLDSIYPNKGSTVTDGIKLTNFEDTLKNLCRRYGTKFVDYRPQTGSWVFMVEHFSRYKCVDADTNGDEDNQTCPSEI